MSRYDKDNNIDKLHIKSRRLEILSNLVCEWMMSGGFAVDLSLIDTVNEFDTVDHVSELVKAA